MEVGVDATFENGPPTFSPICPMAPSGLNCLPIAPPEEMTDGFFTSTHVSYTVPSCNLKSDQLLEEPRC